MENPQSGNSDINMEMASAPESGNAGQSASFSDCYYFLSTGCTKEDCKFRHSEVAKKTNMLCAKYQRGTCSDPECKFIHLNVLPSAKPVPRHPPKTPVHNTAPPKKECLFFKQGKCRNGSNCPFAHVAQNESVKVENGALMEQFSTLIASLMNNNGMQVPQGLFQQGGQQGMNASQNKTVNRFNQHNQSSPFKRANMTGQQDVGLARGQKRAPTLQVMDENGQDPLGRCQPAEKLTGRQMQDKRQRIEKQVNRMIGTQQQQNTTGGVKKLVVRTREQILADRKKEEEEAANALLQKQLLQVDKEEEEEEEKNETREEQVENGIENGIENGVENEEEGDENENEDYEDEDDDGEDIFAGDLEQLAAIGKGMNDGEENECD